jgi:hypothetical protein
MTTKDDSDGFWLLQNQSYSHLAKELLEARNAIFKSFGLSYEKIQERIKKVPDAIKESLFLLGKNGWYFDLEGLSLPDLWKLRKLLLEDNKKEAEDELTRHFEDQLDQIESRVISSFPKRDRFIKAAFRAHRQELFELSIPVLFAQTDGICWETLEGDFFRKRDGKPQTAAFVENLKLEAFQLALFQPLIVNPPISASANDPTIDHSQLNRHSVMHGHSLDYPTRANSLKAISLINYVSQACTNLLERF